MDKYNFLIDKVLRPIYFFFAKSKEIVYNTYKYFFYTISGTILYFIILIGLIILAIITLPGAISAALSGMFLFAIFIRLISIGIGVEYDQDHQWARDIGTKIKGAYKKMICDIHKANKGRKK
jgi:hypothetical protein